ncbi:MAG: B-box zinc finger protein [Victivallales bacterium]|nr:B-box zinc finger protein [Victivallales bacterium]
MAEKINGSVCLNHPDTPAVAHCAVCRKPVCQECQKIYEGVTYCSKECYESAKRTGSMVDDVIKKRKAVELKRKIRNIIILLIIIALAFAGWTYYKKNKSTIDAKAKNLKQQTEKTINDSKKSIDKGLIKDSKYKKEHEGLLK